MTGHAAARVLRGLDDVRQRLARIARDAHAFGNVFDAHPPGAPGRELFARLVRAIAEEVATALEAVNEMADELAKPRQGGCPPVPPNDRAALRGFLARVLGWTTDREAAVEHAVRAIELSTEHRAALVLCGDGDMVPIAAALHRRALGDEKRFVLCDPSRRATDASAQLENRRTGADAIGAATGGAVCLRATRLPRDFAELVAALRDARLQLVLCGRQPPRLTELVLAPIAIPALATRAHELDRIIDEYAHEARLGLKISVPFTEADRHWIRAHSATSLLEVEKGAWRLLALRQTGNIAGAAALLGMGHTSLGEWVQRRRGLGAKLIRGQTSGGLSTDSRPRYPVPELMDEAGNEALRDAIRHMHGCESTFVESVPVHETFNGETVWEGDVEVFDLVGHPQATRAYAWSSSTDTPGRRRFHAVLGVGPITDAVMAVRASVIADTKRPTP